MTSSGMPGRHQPALDPVDELVDHIRGPARGPLILEYGDYECPYSRQAYREIERVETKLAGGVRFAFRHFPLTQIHPHALAAAAAAEAAARQGRFWDMHELLFHRQKALDEQDLQQYAADIGLDTAMFDDDRAGPLGAGRYPPGCQQRPGVRGGAGHPDTVHQRSGAPGRLRRGDLAQGAGPMSRTGTRTAIKLAEPPEAIAGCQNRLATGSWRVHRGSRP